MWKIFYSSNTNFFDNFHALEAWKEDIFKILEVEIKQYFARKVVVYFDNMMIIQQKRGAHHNLMESLSSAEKDMYSVSILYQPINIYIIKEEEGCVLITSGLDDKYIETLLPFNFQLIENNANLSQEKEEKMRHISWSTLVFDVELVNFAKGWINYTPTIEERSILQTEEILMNNHFKKHCISLVDKLNFKDNIKDHPQYTELYQKILRIMPKIEATLDQEWRTAIIQTKILETIGQIKKNKTSM